MTRHLRLFAAALLLLPAIAHADRLSARQDRWIDNANGIILRTPDDATVQEQPTSETMVQFTGPEKGDYTIRVSLQLVTSGIELQPILETAINEIKFVQPSAEVDDQRIAKLSTSYDVAWAYCIVPDKPRTPAQWHRRKKMKLKPEPWIFGRAFVPIGGGRLVVFELSVSADHYQRGRSVFEKMYESLQVRDPAVLIEERRTLVENGSAFWKDVTPEILEKALIPEQLFRIRANNHDVGYMTIRQFETEQMSLPGLQVDVQSRVMEGGRAIDTQNNFFMSWDGDTEVWSIRITDRLQNPPPRADPRHNAKVTFSETGLRSDNFISVKRDGPHGLKKLAWTRPPHGYMNMVESLLLGPLLKNAGDGSYGFYSYSPGSAKIAFRQDTLERRVDGAYTIKTRPTPESGETTILYDPVGRILQQHLPAGREMVPTTKQQLSALWKLR